MKHHKQLPSAAEVARLIGRHPTVVQSWFRGARAPSLEGLGEILEALPHLDARWIVRELLQRKAGRTGR